MLSLASETDDVNIKNGKRRVEGTSPEKKRKRGREALTPGSEKDDAGGDGENEKGQDSQWQRGNGAVKSLFGGPVTPGPEADREGLQDGEGKPKARVLSRVTRGKRCPLAGF